jgi:adsorption protein B
MFPDAYRYPQLVERGTWLWKLILISTFFLFVRSAQRFHSVFHVYGPVQALLSAPRLVWGNFINFFATMRAIRFFWKSKRTGKRIAWDKTDHVNPSEAQLLAFQRPAEAEKAKATAAGGVA